MFMDYSKEYQLYIYITELILL